MLEFEHVIPVNTADQPAHQRVSAESLWQGLLFRARYPAHFNPSLCCELRDEHEFGFTRLIRAGAMALEDKVTFTPLEEIRSLIDGRTQPMHAESVIRMERGAHGVLSVRFRYRRDSLGEQGGVDADEFMKSAYVQNDRDGIAMLKEMIADGWSERLM